MEAPELLQIEGVVAGPEILFAALRDETDWDRRMMARLTASFGVPYNYSGMTFPEIPMPPRVAAVVEVISGRIDFTPNNCLVNYYVTGESKMGFHADSITELEAGTGVAIVSLGAVRKLRFRKIGQPSLTHDYLLQPGSLLYMPPEVQLAWKHAVPADPDAGSRISLTFRRLAGH